MAEAARLQPGNAETLEELGAVYAKAGQKEKLQETGERLEKLDKARGEKFFSIHVVDRPVGQQK